MQRLRFRLLTLTGVATLLILLAPCAARAASRQARTSNLSVSKITVVASGLNNPRGLRFGPDGNLYVAEAGLGGTLSNNSCPMPASARPSWPWPRYRWLHVSHL